MTGGTVYMKGSARNGAREWKPAGANSMTCLMGRGAGDEEESADGARNTR